MLALPTLLLCLAPVGDGKPYTVAVQPEEPKGHALNPAELATPLRQDLTSLTLTARGEGLYSVKLGEGDQALELAQAPLALLVPRVPAYARGQEDLVRYTLLQREFNRSDVDFGKSGAADAFKLANNGLHQGLWEVLLERQTDLGRAQFFHGWFEFPLAAYAAEFERLNGVPLAQHERFLAQYRKLDGLAAPLDRLRTVTSESLLILENRVKETPVRFGEQQRKAKLLLSKDLGTYGDFVTKARQPIQFASFGAPGVYDDKAPASFDLAWLAQPERAVRRDVTLARGGAKATEVEIAYTNGYRLIVADRDLGQLPKRAAEPADDAQTLRLTFGIGTPDLHAAAEQRASELAEERPNWLLLLGRDGAHVDNHKAGLQRVFAWFEQGDPGRLHLYLIGHEGIAVINHLALPWIKL